MMFNDPTYVVEKVFVAISRLIHEFLDPCHHDAQLAKRMSREHSRDADSADHARVHDESGHELRGKNDLVRRTCVHWDQFPVSRAGQHTDDPGFVSDRDDLRGEARHSAVGQHAALHESCTKTCYVPADSRVLYHHSLILSPPYDPPIRFHVIYAIA